MPITTAPESLFTLHLQPAQRAWERLPGGAEIAVQQGTVRLHVMAYLAGMWVEQPVLLHAGERHRVEVAGWMQMEAVGAAQVSAEVPPGWREVGRQLYACWQSALCRILAKRAHKA